MKISEMGEDNFIETIKQKIAVTLPKGVIGIGDDCAVIPYEGDKLMLLSTDSLVEGIHFLKGKTSPNDLGYKAVMVNVSDIAAMGGKPLYLLMSIAMPKETEESWITKYIEGIKEACHEANISLIGGDTTGSKGGIFINFTIIGEVTKDNVKYRNTARVGDLVCITDILGDSLAGFQLMMKGELHNPLVKKHVRPKAQFKEGKWLGQHSAVRAMMDVSDGLLQDLTRMIKASACGAELDLEKIPTSHSPEQAVISGEEYCLLLTVDPAGFDDLQTAFEKKFGRPLYAVGIIKQEFGLRFLREGKEVKIESKGYLHF